MYSPWQIIPNISAQICAVLPTKWCAFHPYSGSALALHPIVSPSISGIKSKENVPQRQDKPFAYSKFPTLLIPFSCRWRGKKLHPFTQSSRSVLLSGSLETKYVELDLPSAGTVIEKENTTCTELLIPFPEPIQPRWSSDHKEPRVCHLREYSVGVVYLPPAWQVLSVLFQWNEFRTGYPRYFASEALLEKVVELEEQRFQDVWMVQSNRNQSSMLVFWRL